jgi:hypothetical protein
MGKETFALIILPIATLVLVIYEFVGIYQARKKGLTKNKSRIVTHGLMIILLLTLLLIIINFVIKFWQLTKALP